MATERHDIAWQGAESVRWFLDSVRGAIPFAAEQLEIMLQMVEQSRRPIARFLDVGCGDGVLTAAMLTRYPSAQGVLVDFSEPMLDAARERFRSAARSPLFVAGDLATEAWTDGVAAHAPFDAIVSGFAIHHLEDDRKHALYGELFDLLAPGGVFAHIEHVASGSRWIGDAYDEAMIDAIWAYRQRGEPALTRAQAAADYANRPDASANRLAPLERQCDWLWEAGFVNVDVPFRWFEIAIFGGFRPGE